MRATSVVYGCGLALGILGCHGRKPVDRPGAAAVVAGGARRLVVPANRQVTLVGQYRAGARVDVEPTGGSWSAGPERPMVGAAGQPNALCLGDGAHHCIGGDAMAPWMGLLVLMTPCPIEQQGCQVFGRDPVSAPMTFTVPRDGFMYLAPNDWMEAVGDNRGALTVDVAP